MTVARQIIATALAVVMFTATAWCICIPTTSMPGPADANAASAPCCRTHGRTNDAPQRPAQDCPSCSWSVLRSAIELNIATTIDQPTHPAPFVAIPAPVATLSSASFSFHVEPHALPPPAQTLFDLHCQLLT